MAEMVQLGILLLHFKGVAHPEQADDSFVEAQRRINYQINRLAQVRSVKTGKLLKPYDDGSGYLRVKLDGENCRLHILVALAFIPNPEKKPVVNHKHGKKHDCRGFPVGVGHHIREHKTRLGSWIDSEGGKNRGR